MAPHPIPLPCALAFPPPNHRDATVPSPCWAPHFVTQERIMFSNLTPSKLRLSSAATMSDDMLSALTPPLHCAFTLQPATPPQVVAFESLTISAPICLNRFIFAESRKSDFWTCACVFTFSSSDFAFLISMNFSFKSPFAIWSPQQFHYYFYLSIVSWQYQKYSTILILVLCLLCVTPLVCLCYWNFAPSSPFFSSWWQKDCDLFTSPMFSIDVVASAPDDPCICW